uniref:Uncharacterized protein n=1 Tax=Myoviridae sp. ctTBm11 TaxID=2825108 RepID=A0A8S5PQ42_9CAUD|nr:MAG TPA: hypothetical protein [Myoviridae sp. ctTBm11]
MLNKFYLINFIDYFYLSTIDMYSLLLNLI